MPSVSALAALCVVAQTSAPASAPVDVAPIAVAADALAPDADTTAAFSSHIDLTPTQRTTADPSAAEALRQSAGTAVRSLGGIGDFSTVAIRGSSSAQIGVYLDGAPLSPTSIGTVDLSTLWLFDLASLDVYRGLAPVTLGPDGFLGALVLKTPRRIATGGVAHVGAGSFATRHVGLRAALTLGAWTLAGSAVYFGKTGDFPYADDGGTPLATADDRTIARPNNDQNAGAFTLTLQREVLGRARFAVVADFFTKEQGSPGPSSIVQQNARFAQWRPVLRARLDDCFLHPRVRLDVLLSAAGNVAHFSDLLPSFYSGTTEQTTRELELRANHVLTWLATDWLTAAASLNAGGTIFDARSPSFSAQERQRFLAGGSLSLRGAWLDDRIELEAASRIDGLRDRGRSAPSLFQRDVLEAIDASRVWLQPALGMRGAPLPGLSLAAHVGRRERVPNFYELFGSDGQVRGNPALRPEQQWTWDAGAHFFHRRFIAADAVYSEGRLDQLIALVYAGIELPRAENIGRAIVRSVELSARAEPVSFLRLAATYTFQHTANLSDGIALNKPLPGRPPHQARIETTFLIPRPVDARVMFEFQYIAATYLDTTALRSAPSRYVLNATLSVRPWSGPVRLTLDLRNLLDQRTQSLVASAAGDRVNVSIVDFIGFPLPGRSVFFTLSYAFGEMLNLQETPS
ncbi:MAG: TonB-dependent receptor [Deltaproteobacteria bacterium]|nr:TonB-dependent receptor [Deltaproteobacteria bacterium]